MYNVVSYRYIQNLKRLEIFKIYRKVIIIFVFIKYQIFGAETKIKPFFYVRKKLKKKFFFFLTITSTRCYTHIRNGNDRPLVCYACNNVYTTHTYIYSLILTNNINACYHFVDLIYYIITIQTRDNRERQILLLYERPSKR